MYTVKLQSCSHYLCSQRREDPRLILRGTNLSFKECQFIIRGAFSNKNCVNKTTYPARIGFLILILANILAHADSDSALGSVVILFDSNLLAYTSSVALYTCSWVNFFSILNSRTPNAWAISQPSNQLALVHARPESSLKT